MIIEKLKNRDVLIYGARIVANEVANIISDEPYLSNILAFMVSELEGNPSTLVGKQVITVEMAKERFSSDVLVIIACMEKYVDEIIGKLEQVGFCNQVVLSFESDTWADVRGYYFKHYCDKQKENYLFLDDNEKLLKRRNSDFAVFCAHNHFDKKLDEDVSRYEWEIPIQVGADLTKEVLCEIMDNSGLNISDRNASYCELTGLYWIWKNKYAPYKGISHYRRHFELDEKKVADIEKQDIDIIVTVPIFNYPSVKSVYCHDHMENDWNVMLNGIKTLYPDYIESAMKVQNGTYYFAYNMIIAKNNVFNTYCEWLFSILKYCEDNCEKREDKYQGRFLGFLSERLMTIFIIHHKNDYKIAICRKHFIEK